MDFRLIIVTNQAGIGLGYFSKEDFYRINRYMFHLFFEKNIRIDKIYFAFSPATFKWRFWFP